MNVAFINALPTTVNFHINYKCNADCVFCYRIDGAELSFSDQCKIVDLLAPHTDRLNIAGGEPTLVKTLPALLKHAQSVGLKTSLITNGSVYHRKPEKLDHVLPWLDMIGVSIDSIDADTNRKNKRPHFSAFHWCRLAKTVENFGVVLKINTVVCRFNLHEDLSAFISEMNPGQFKVFQASPIADTDGTTQHRPIDWQVSDDEFKSFIARHSLVNPVVESGNAMRGSYAMISPDGCFYDSANGTHRKSDPILSCGVKNAFGQVAFSHSKFVDRGGLYQIAVVSR